MENKARLHHIESIRAFAALSVALFHFTNYSAEGYFLIKSEFTRNLFSYGAQGVEMFYLISGFIIPYALYKGSYQIKHYFRYLTKRLLRLLPPYYITIALITLVSFLLYKYAWNIPYNIQFRNLAANATFMVDFIAAFDGLLAHFPDNAWINPIFETLKVEFQFYILIGILFPLLNRNRYLLVFIGLVLLVLGICTQHMNTVLVNSPYFLLGISSFYIFKEGWKWEYMVLVLLCFICLFVAYAWQDLLVAILSFSLVVFLPTSFSFLSFTGKISYSYYLVHGLTGGWFLYFNLNSVWFNNYPWVLILVALLISWCGAFLMYLCIEKPSIRLSKKINYKKN